VKLCLTWLTLTLGNLSSTDVKLCICIFFCTDGYCTIISSFFLSRNQGYLNLSIGSSWEVNWECSLITITEKPISRRPWRQSLSRKRYLDLFWLQDESICILSFSAKGKTMFRVIS
jgi:hypothetical protein